jgi:hypothetical protein
MIAKLNKAFSHIYFIEEGHKYLNIDTNEYLISVTTKKKDYVRQFEGKQKDYWLNRKATEAGITPDEMQEEWDEKRIVGTTRGSIIHDYAENISNRKITAPELNIPGLAKLKRQINLYFRDHIDYVNIATELVVGNDKIGGMIDRLCLNEKGQLGIVDFKSDREFKESYGKKMKKPYNHLPSDSIHGYYLQVNMYRELLEEKGFNIEFMEIVHFGINNDDYVLLNVPKIDIIW